MLAFNTLVNIRVNGTANLNGFTPLIDKASTALETTAFERRIEIKVYGTKGFFPTPEDLILLKLIPGRAKDIADVEGLIARHGDKLDKEYLKAWAMKLCDEAEDMRIWTVLEELLKG